MNRPKGSSSKTFKYENTHHGKQRFGFRDFSRRFVEDPSRQPVSEETRELVNRYLNERLVLAATWCACCPKVSSGQVASAICCITGVW